MSYCSSGDACPVRSSLARQGVGSNGMKAIADELLN